MKAITLVILTLASTTLAAPAPARKPSPAKPSRPSRARPSAAKATTFDGHYIAESHSGYALNCPDDATIRGGELQITVRVGHSIDLEPFRVKVSPQGKIEKQTLPVGTRTPVQGVKVTESDQRIADELTEMTVTGELMSQNDAVGTGRVFDVNLVGPDGPDGSTGYNCSVRFLADSWKKNTKSRFCSTDARTCGTRTGSPCCEHTY